jgi:hypothetical protein
MLERAAAQVLCEVSCIARGSPNVVWVLGLARLYHAAISAAS